MRLTLGVQGKGNSRAVRGHGLLEVALYADLLSPELGNRAFDGNDMIPEQNGVRVSP